VGGLSLKNIAMNWLGFLPLLGRVSHDTSCVLVHGYSSCDIGLLEPLCILQNGYGLVYAKTMRKLNCISLP
jgi:hypothetical protein